MSVKECDVPGLVPVALRLNAPLLVPYRTTHVADRSVAKAMTVLVVPESVAVISEVNDTRFTSIEVEPVFPNRSVATTLMIFTPPVRLLITFDQVPVQRVAAAPFTKTLAMPPVSVVVPENTGEPLTRAPLECDVIATTGAMVSAVAPIVYESVFDALFVFQAASENVPLPTETVTVPVDAVGVIVNEYPVPLRAVNPLAVALVVDISP